ncbi:MAG: metal ABC transporter substrate-binding protein [Sulfurimonas sp.]
MKRSTTIIIFLFIVIVLVAVSLSKKQQVLKNRKAIVAVTTFSLYDITKHIAGNSVEIVNILPFGVDPHDYEPTPKTMANIEKASLSIYSGAGLEPWMHGFSFKSKVIDMSQFMELRKLTKDELHGDEVLDPHYWLDFSNMETATELITEELIKIVPKNRDTYLKNRDAYLTMLKKLDMQFKNGLANCERDTIIVNHNAFGYLADRYNFHVESLSGLSPDAQPNAQNVIRLLRTIKEHNVSTVFFESFASDRAIKGIALEAHTKVDVLQPLGNITADTAKKELTYEDIMKENLLKLSGALACH